MTRRKLAAVDDEIAGVADRIAADLRIDVTTAMCAVTDAVDNLPKADALLIEHAARARLHQSGRSPNPGSTAI